MTKAEFLELRAGEQRWILLQSLRWFVLAMLIDEKEPLMRAILSQFDSIPDTIAQKIPEDES